MENVVKLVDVCRRYGEGENAVNALSDVNVEISRGEFGQTVVMITHNELLTTECDRVLVMKDGRLTERGRTA